MFLCESWGVWWGRLNVQASTCLTCSHWCAAQLSVVATRREFKVQQFFVWVYVCRFGCLSRVYTQARAQYAERKSASLSLLSFLLFFMVHSHLKLDILRPWVMCTIDMCWRWYPCLSLSPAFLGYNWQITQSDITTRITDITVVVICYWPPLSCEESVAVYCD